MPFSEPEASSSSGSQAKISASEELQHQFELGPTILAGREPIEEPQSFNNEFDNTNLHQSIPTPHQPHEIASSNLDSSDSKLSAVFTRNMTVPHYLEPTKYAYGKGNVYDVFQPDRTPTLTVQSPPVRPFSNNERTPDPERRGYNAHPIIGRKLHLPTSLALPMTLTRAALASKPFHNLLHRKLQVSLMLLCSSIICMRIWIRWIDA